MTHQLDPARTQLLARLLTIPRFQDQDETFLARRLSRMSDQRVATVLAMADEEFHELSKDSSEPRYAPATSDSPPVTLWYHGYGG
ncbi:hypothetical protein [Streptomyces zaomyceticus]|uniref:hypothetical protein n=1 Tax=Streptomyces zaomyceticus TaxID=68286 RepID=UPI0037931E11